VVRLQVLRLSLCRTVEVTILLCWTWLVTGMILRCDVGGELRHECVV
jgi:hypothetical protein